MLGRGENEAGELTGVSVNKSVTIGKTPLGAARNFYPGLGSDQNKLSAVKTTDGSFKISMEQHASVSKAEEFGLNQMGFKIVNVAQKLDVSISNKGTVAVSAATDIFPSATLKVNNNSIMQYNQPSFTATHSAPIIGYSSSSAGFAPTIPKPIYDTKYKPAMWYKRL